MSYPAISVAAVSGIIEGTAVSCILVGGTVLLLYITIWAYEAIMMALGYKRNSHGWF